MLIKIDAQTLLKYRSYFVLSLLICIGFIGCDEQGSLDPVILSEGLSNLNSDAESAQLSVELFAQLSTELSELEVISPVPDYVFDGMKEFRDRLAILRKTLYESENADPEKKRALEQKMGQSPIVDYDILPLQKVFYTKYVNAAGITVLAEEKVPDRYVKEAGRIVVTMTAKHPKKLRQRLTMENSFYMVLLDTFTDDWDMPHKIPGYGFKNSNSCYRLGQTGLCWSHIAAKSRWDEPDRLRVFAHEFAHALDHEMQHWDPYFYDKLDTIYNAASERYEKEGIGVPALSYGRNSREYWASAVEDWFYALIDDPDTYKVPGWPADEPKSPFHDWSASDNRNPDDFYSVTGLPITHTYDRYKELDPLLYDLLSEWFPKVTLRDYTHCKLYYPFWNYRCVEPPTLER